MRLHVLDHLRERVHGNRFAAQKRFADLRRTHRILAFNQRERKWSQRLLGELDIGSWSTNANHAIAPANTNQATIDESHLLGWMDGWMDHLPRMLDLSAVQTATSCMVSATDVEHLDAISNSR
jgi:hypothetical protein